ncbi:hypothetical protein V6U81_28650, partial [Micromonospora sp. CPCC 205711]
QAHAPARDRDAARAAAEPARQETAAVAARAREELAAAAVQRDAVGAELAAARQAGAHAQARLAGLEVRLHAVEGDRDAAQRRAAQLADQVSDLAGALARLGSAGRPG